MSETKKSVWGWVVAGIGVVLGAIAGVEEVTAPTTTETVATETTATATAPPVVVETVGGQGGPVEVETPETPDPPVTVTVVDDPPDVPDEPPQAPDRGAGQLRGGYAFPLPDGPERARYNLQLLPNLRLHEKIWNDSNFQRIIELEGDKFPVRLWMQQADAEQKVLFYKRVMVHRYNGAVVALTEHKAGQVLIVEYTPALLSDEWSPLVSRIELSTNDPSTQKGVRVSGVQVWW